MSVWIYVLIVAAVSIISGLFVGIKYNSIGGGICCFVVALLLSSFIAYFTWCEISMHSAPEEYTIQLSEMDDGIYAYQSEVVSRVPAENYSSLTVRQKNGQVMSIKGHVEIIYQNAEEPYAKIIDKNIINSDTIIAYVPSGSVVFKGTISVN